jgi:hypothetical protein
VAVVVPPALFITVSVYCVVPTAVGFCAAGSAVVPLQLTVNPPTEHDVGVPPVATVTLTVSTPAPVVAVLTVKLVMVASTHAWLVLHEHAPVPLHVQSVTRLHPHALFTHCVPVVFALQSTHTPTPEPSLVVLVPHCVGPSAFVAETHWPVVVLQQVPLHRWVASHVLTHCPLPLHDSPDAQSDAEVQPQA